MIIFSKHALNQLVTVTTHIQAITLISKVWKKIDEVITFATDGK